MYNNGKNQPACVSNAMTHSGPENRNSELEKKLLYEGMLFGFSFESYDCREDIKKEKKGMNYEK